MSRSSAARKKIQYTRNVGGQGKANPNQSTPPNFVQSQNLTSIQGSQWPANLPTDKPYPDMPQVSDLKPLLQQYGASGVAIFSGIITSEEYNPDFFWRDGIKIYEQMLRNDGQIAAVRDMVELPIRRATWSVEPFSTNAKDVEVASFVESCLMHDMCYETTEGRKLYQKWDDILRHALMHLWYGFMTFEVNWRVEDGWVKWANWTPLIPRTVWRWWVGEDNELVGIQQWTFKNYSYQFVNIPAEKLLLFSHRQEGNNYEGVSALRQAYKDWYYKTQYEKIQAIGIERNAVVPPVITLPENYTSNDVAVAQMIAQNMRANEMMGVTIPNTWSVEFPRNQQRYAANSLEAIQYHDVMIARRMLCQFLNLGSNETGTYALADTQVQTFLSALQTIANYIEDVINSDAIPRLCDYNFDGLEGYPKLKASRLQADIKVISDALKSVLGQNALLTPYPELQSWFADQLGIPQPPEGMNVVQQTNPTKPTNPDQPDKQQNKPDDAGTKQVKGAPVDDGGNVGNMLAEMTEQVTLLRESMTAMDAVERGEQHQKQLSNLNRFENGVYAPKGTGDLTGGGHGHASGFGRSGGGEGVTHVSHHAAGTSGGGGSHGGSRKAYFEEGARLRSESARLHQEHAEAERRGDHEQAKTLRRRIEENERAQIEHSRQELRVSIRSRQRDEAQQHSTDRMEQFKRTAKDPQDPQAVWKAAHGDAQEAYRMLRNEPTGNLEHMLGHANMPPGERPTSNAKEAIARNIVSRLDAYHNGNAATFYARGTGPRGKSSSRSGKSTDDRLSRLEARMTRAESAHSAERAAHAETKKQLKQMQHENERLRRENEQLKARAEGTKTGRSRSSGKSTTNRVEVDRGLHPIRKIVGRDFDITKGVEPHFLHQVYGTRQLPRALGRYTHTQLKAAAREMHVTPGRTKEETVKRIVKAQVAQDGTIEEGQP